MVKKSLSEWLDWIKTQHAADIDLSLERVALFGRRLGLMNPTCAVVTVGGTNGKGSCVAGLEAIYQAAGYRVGTFTTPFLLCYNEQVRIQGVPVEDHVFCDAFAQIEKVCDDITLTPFEWGTLAALMIFKEAALDVWILEVGMGGRYDAVNILDADAAIVASISIDHVDWLGDTREAIAYEKAGIFRADKPAICGDFDPPSTLLAEPVKKLYCQRQQFGYALSQGGWRWWCENKQYDGLPQPRLALQNMSTVLMAIEVLQERLPVSRHAIDSGLKNVNLPGRLQVIPGEVMVIFDVSHNPASAQFLADFLANQPCSGKTHAVFSMLGDKDIIATLNIVKESFDSWEVAPLPILRGATMDKLQHSFQRAGILATTWHPSVEKAFISAQQKSQPGDRVVVFGSFHTVASAAAVFNPRALASTL